MSHANVDVLSLLGDVHGPWAVVACGNFRKESRRLSRDMLDRLAEAVRRLLRDPLGACSGAIQPLKFNLREYRRVRLGKYRLVYQADPVRKIITLVGITTRDCCYAQI